MSRYYKIKIKNLNNSKSKIIFLLVQVIIVGVTEFILPPHVLCGRGQSYKGGKNGWFRRFALPKSSTLLIQPTLTIPAMPDDDNGSTTGFTSSAEISFPTTIYFDNLGWTTLFNTISTANILYPSSVSIFNLLGRRRYKRGLKSDPTVPWTRHINYDNETKTHLGNLDRAVLLPTIVKTLNAMGVDGRPCLQRAICEIHEDSLKGYGLLGEVLILVFSVSRSRFAKTKHLRDLLEAERLGKRNNCHTYTSRCKTSIFKWHRN